MALLDSGINTSNVVTCNTVELIVFSLRYILFRSFRIEEFGDMFCTDVPKHTKIHLYNNKE